MKFYDRHVKSYCIFNKLTLSWQCDENEDRVTGYYIHDSTSS